MFVISNKVTKATVRRGQRTEVADLPQLNDDVGRGGKVVDNTRQPALVVGERGAQGFTEVYSRRVYELKQYLQHNVKEKFTSRTFKMLRTILNEILNYLN